jgi:hypothetical protein
VIGRGRAPAELAASERRAYDSLHDCLADLDPATADLLHWQVLADHVRSLQRAYAHANLDPNLEGPIDVPTYDGT